MNSGGQVTRGMAGGLSWLLVQLICSSTEQFTDYRAIQSSSVMEQSSPRNAIGATVRLLRNQRGWTQEILAAKCEVAGCAISRGTLAKIEAQIRTATDIETYVLAQVLKVGIDALYPKGFPGQLRRSGWSRSTVS